MKIKSTILIAIGVVLFLISAASKYSGGSNGQEAITNFISHLAFVSIILGGCRMVVDAVEERK